MFAIRSCCLLALPFECKKQRQHPHITFAVAFHIPRSALSPSLFPLSSLPYAASNWFLYDAGGGGGRSSSGVALFSYLLLAFCFCLVLCALCFLLFVVICLLLCLAFLEQSPFTRLCVLLLALSRSRLPRKPLSALSCLIVCVCAASLFRQCSTLAFTSWDLCIFSNWRGQHRFVFLLFSLCSGFFIFFFCHKNQFFGSPFFLNHFRMAKFCKALAQQLNSYQNARRQQEWIHSKLLTTATAETFVSVCQSHCVCVCSCLFLVVAAALISRLRLPSIKINCDYF